jgi:hypothetical protein
VFPVFPGQGGAGPGTLRHPGEQRGFPPADLLCARWFFGGFGCLVQLPEGAEKLGPMAGQTAQDKRVRGFSKDGCFSPGPSGGIIPEYHTQAAAVLGQFCLHACNLGGRGRCADGHP